VLGVTVEFRNVGETDGSITNNGLCGCRLLEWLLFGASRGDSPSEGLRTARSPVFRLLSSVAHSVSEQRRQRYERVSNQHRQKMVLEWRRYLGHCRSLMFRHQSRSTRSYGVIYQPRTAVVSFRDLVFAQPPRLSHVRRLLDRVRERWQLWSY